MQVQVQFIKFGANTVFGSFAPGDKMRCSQELAKHLVDEIGCAKYVEQPQPAQQVTPELVKRTRKGK